MTPAPEMLAFSVRSALTLIAPDGLIWYWSAFSPDTNTALPAAEMQVSRAWSFGG